VTLIQPANAIAKPIQGLSRPVSMHVPKSDDEMRGVRPFFGRHRTRLKPRGEIVEPRRLMMCES
jgi:hypothetical protein